MGARYFCVNIDDWREQTIATIHSIFTHCDETGKKQVTRPKNRNKE